MFSEIKLRQAQLFLNKFRNTGIIESFQEDRERKFEQARNVLTLFKEQRLSNFDIFRKAGFQADENMLSDAIAALLDPRESHYLGIWPLQKLLDKIETKAPASAAGVIKTRLEQNQPYIRVFREKREEKTIPDLEICGNDFLIFIENKIRGGQETYRGNQWQTDRQWAILQRKSEIHGTSILAIFLTPEGKPARNPNFVSLSVNEIITSLREAVVAAQYCPYAHSIQTFLDFYFWE